MVAAPANQTAETLLAQIDAERLHLRELLATADPARSSERPPSGKWSILENVRHLLFAEQAHLGQFVEGGRDWSPAGFTPAAMLRARKLDVDPAGLGLDDVVAAWDAVHEGIRERFPARDDERVRKSLWTNLRHLQGHITIIERIMKAQARKSTSG